MAKKKQPGGGRTTPPGQPPQMRIANPQKLADYFRQRTLELTNEVALLRAITMEDAETIQSLTDRIADLLDDTSKGEKNAAEEKARGEGSKPKAGPAGGLGGTQGSSGSSGSGSGNGRRASSSKRS